MPLRHTTILLLAEVCVICGSWGTEATVMIKHNPGYCSKAKSYKVFDNSVQELEKPDKCRMIFNILDSLSIFTVASKVKDWRKGRVRG